MQRESGGGGRNDHSSSSGSGSTESTISLTRTLSSPGTSRSACSIARRSLRIDSLAAWFVMRAWICSSPSHHQLPYFP